MGALTIAINISIVVEMISVNILFVNLYAKKRYSGTVTYFWLILITAVLMLASIVAMQSHPGTSNGNGLFILAGMVYVLPLRILYEKPFNRVMIILFTSWVYTALAFTIGVQIARLFPEQKLTAIVFAFQTVFYIVSLLLFRRMLMGKYAEIVNNISKRISGRYLCTVFMMFLSIVMINYAFVTGKQHAALFSFILVSITCSLCLHFVFTTIATEKSNTEMSLLTYYDSLTGLPNRNSLLAFFDKYVSAQKPFSLTFIDLDCFKRINDEFGHNAGDDYLYHFAQLLKDQTGNCADVFRLHGDEFILLSGLTGKEMRALLYECEKKIKKSFPNHPFLGFSAGAEDVVEWPRTLDGVLAAADQRLYEEKGRKKSVRV